MFTSHLYGTCIASSHCTNTVGLLLHVGFGKCVLVLTIWWYLLLYIFYTNVQSCIAVIKCFLIIQIWTCLFSWMSLPSLCPIIIEVNDLLLSVGIKVISLPRRPTLPPHGVRGKMNCEAPSVSSPCCSSVSYPVFRVFVRSLLTSVTLWVPENKELQHVSGSYTRVPCSASFPHLWTQWYLF